MSARCHRCDSQWLSDRKKRRSNHCAGTARRSLVLLGAEAALGGVELVELLGAANYAGGA